MLTFGFSKPWNDPTLLPCALLHFFRAFAHFCAHFFSLQNPCPRRDFFRTGSFTELADGTTGFAVQNAFLKVTTTGAVTLSGKGLFSTGDTFEITGAVTDKYIAINTVENVVFSYAIDGVKCMEKTMSFVEKQIYNIASDKFPTPVAKVGDQGYFTLADAINAANGATVTLLADITSTVTIDKACTINTNGFAFDYTVATDCRETTNGNTITIEKLVASTWTIIGDNNNWTEGNAEITMYNTSTENLFVAYNVSFTDDTKALGDSKDYNEFKIRQNKAWTTSYGIGACVKSGYKVKLRSNYRNTGIEENGTYDIYFNSSTKEIAVMPVGETWSSAKEPKFNDGNATCTWGITGSMTGWGTPDITMYYDGTYWYAKGVQFESGDTFKCRQNAAWSWSYGKNNKQSATSIGDDGDNIKATAKCCYDVYVSKTQHKVWFKEAGQRP